MQANVPNRKILLIFIFISLLNNHTFRVATLYSLLRISQPKYLRLSEKKLGEALKTPPNHYLIPDIAFTSPIPSLLCRPHG